MISIDEVERPTAIIERTGGKPRRHFHLVAARRNIEPESTFIIRCSARDWCACHACGRHSRDCYLRLGDGRRGMVHNDSLHLRRSHGS